MDKNYQKKFYTSSNDVLNLINEGLDKISQVTHDSQSEIIEQYVLLGLLRDLDESSLRDKIIDTLNKKMTIREIELEHYRNIIKKG